MPLNSDDLSLCSNGQLSFVSAVGFDCVLMRMYMRMFAYVCMYVCVRVYLCVSLWVYCVLGMQLNISIAHMINLSKGLRQYCIVLCCFTFTVVYCIALCCIV